MMLTMKVFLSILPTLYFCTANNGVVLGNRTGVSEPDNQKISVWVIPGKLEYVTTNISFTNDSFHVSYEGSSFFEVRRVDNQTIAVTVSATTGSNVTQMIVSNCTSTVSLQIHISQCPLGLHVDNKGGICVCPETKVLRTFPALQCDNSTFEAKVFFGYCVDYSREDALLLARCPLTISESLISAYIPINRSTDFCRIFNRKNESFCSNCTEDHGISVYSDTYECILCNSTTKRRKDIVSYLAIQIIPSTVFFLFVLYFHIGVTSGPANGYIFFAQTMTTPFEAIFLHYFVQMFFRPFNVQYLSKGLVESVIAPYSIWNLDFYRIFGIKSCLSPNLRPMDILALQYVSALYPFLLLVVCYIIIELQSMNFRPVLWMLKIICFPCMRWRRIWKARISILDTFAAYVLLTYYKVMYVTFLLLSATEVFNHRLGGKRQYVLSVDPSIAQYSKEHLPFLFLAVGVFLTFGLFPPLLLTFYQFKTCYSFLERARLKRPGLEQFVLAFQGCYKDGTNGSPDRRFFAGFYFVFRLLMAVIMTMLDDSLIVFEVKVIACIGFVCVCAMAQPYKQKKYTVIDCTFFSLLAIISAFQSYVYTLLQETGKFSRSILINQTLMYIPLMYMIMYMARWLFLCFKNRDTNSYLLFNDGELKDTLSENREINRHPVNIDISPRPSITRTEVSIAELSQENDSETESEEEELSPLMGKKREMRIFSQHAATESQEYILPQ